MPFCHGFKGTYYKLWQLTLDLESKHRQMADNIFSDIQVVLLWKSNAQDFVHKTLIVKIVCVTFSYYKDDLTIWDDFLIQKCCPTFAHLLAWKPQCTDVVRRNEMSIFYWCIDQYSLEEGHNLQSQFLSSPEALWVQHDLCNELPVRCGHSQAAEQLLQVVREVGTPSISWIHGDEDGHVAAHFHLLANQLNSDGCGWRKNSNYTQYGIILTALNIFWI